MVCRRRLIRTWLKLQLLYKGRREAKERKKKQKAEENVDLKQGWTLKDAEKRIMKQALEEWRTEINFKIRKWRAIRN